MERAWLSKAEFKEKYGYKETKYQAFVKEILESEYRDAIIRPSNKEVWIDEEILQDFLMWKSQNRFRVLARLEMN
ncbi:hypothetical protein [Liquorilactobacillus mali]|uniref:hypothetical protein n=1 Tax=Liquorilactobacillus mali TaxID=1618 RepID=UPI0023507E58|nr:hypothetical protein [Liquorilactobacillus mali]MDC7953571.1 hypothetical protein [Liquorilactobacillus mali]